MDYRVLGIFGPPSYGIGAITRIGREMLCLLYAGFLSFFIRKSTKHAHHVIQMFVEESILIGKWVPLCYSVQIILAPISSANETHKKGTGLSMAVIFIFLGAMNYFWLNCFLPLLLAIFSLSSDFSPCSWIIQEANRGFFYQDKWVDLWRKWSTRNTARYAFLNETLHLTII